MLSTIGNKVAFRLGKNVRFFLLNLVQHYTLNRAMLYHMPSIPLPQDGLLDKLEYSFQPPQHATDILVMAADLNAKAAKFL